MTLRTRILLSLAPLGLLLAGLGVAGFLLLERMGGRIDAILRENYESVQAMFRLNEATERIDSSFQFALAGREAEAAKQFAANWKVFDEQFDVEANNITIHPAEDESGRPAAGTAHRLPPPRAGVLRPDETARTGPRRTSAGPAIRGCSGRSRKSRRWRTRSSGSTGRTWSRPATRRGPPPVRH